MSTPSALTQSQSFTCPQSSPNTNMASTNKGTVQSNFRTKFNNINITVEIAKALTALESDRDKM